MTLVFSFFPGVCNFLKSNRQ
uniref:Uncharacterized protein n=1 Tax=Anguilla anguilla TaxID=7936 RepID=A0A0E9S1V1_ANGAN